MRRLFIIVTMILLIFTYFPAGAAVTANLFVEPLDLSRFPQITVRLSAWDQAGRPFAGLEPENFTLKEDDGEPFIPDAVTSDPAAPLAVALVVDVSGSMAGQPLVDAKAAAARFLDRLTSGDKVAVVAFSDTVNPDPAILDPARELALSSDRQPAYSLVENLGASGGTHLYTAADKGVQLLMEQPAGHRAVLLLSDGRNEPAGEGNPDEPITLAQQANIPIYVIGLGNLIDEPYLQRLAGETGGFYRSAPRSGELAVLFNDMAALLKTQYVFSYESKLEEDGREHLLNISLNRDGSTAEQEIAFGPVPLAPPTITPTLIPTLTATPTAAPTLTPEPSQTPKPTLLPTLEPTPTPIPARLTAYGFLKNNPWLLCPGVLLLAGILFLLFRKPRPKPVPEVCAKCAFDMTGKVGACPQCGETRRLPKPKK